MQHTICMGRFPVSILQISIAGRYRPVRVADGPITARCRFIKNAGWENIRTFRHKLGRFKQKCVFEHAQNAHFQITLCMRKALSRPLLSIHTF